jgi:ATP-binding protein involved in chromosome partitioning
VAEDPRTAVVEERLRPVRRVIAVTGGKGGIGKSFMAASLAIAAAERGSRAGLFDLDLTSPSIHVILGVESAAPSEDFGIDPMDADGIALMSIACFSHDAPVPLRGPEMTSALLELLAITKWQDLDVLFLDMPPGLGDTALDVVRLIDRIEFLVVGGSSPVVLAGVERAVRLLSEIGSRIVGVVDNMHRSGDGVARLARRYDVPFLGTVPYDDAVDDALGNRDRLRRTEAFRAVAALLDGFEA